MTMTWPRSVYGEKMEMAIGKRTSNMFRSHELTMSSTKGQTLCHASSSRRLVTRGCRLQRIRDFSGTATCVERASQLEGGLFYCQVEERQHQPENALP